MKKELFFHPHMLPFFPLITGAVGFVMRLILMKTQIGIDGLLTARHPLSILLYVLSLCTLAVLFMCVRPLKVDPRRYRRMFRQNTWCAFGAAAAGVGSLVTALQVLDAQKDFFNILLTLMSFVAAVCLGLLGYHRQKGMKPHYLVHAGIVVYLMFYLISLYRTWSPEPQLPLYVFQLLGSVCLLLCSYQAICLDMQKGDRRVYTFFNQAALFFCLLSLTDANLFFYLGMSFYMATNLCSMHISRTYLGEEEALPTEETEADSEEA